MVKYNRVCFRGRLGTKKGCSSVYCSTPNYTLFLNACDYSLRRIAHNTVSNGRNVFQISTKFIKPTLSQCLLTGRLQDTQSESQSSGTIRPAVLLSDKQDFVNTLTHCHILNVIAVFVIFMLLCCHHHCPSVSSASISAEWE